MENSERETMVEEKKNEECSIAEEPIIYRGWKTMPFVIGEIGMTISVLISLFGYFFSLIIYRLWSSFFDLIPSE